MRVLNQKSGEPRAVRPGVEKRLSLHDQHCATSIGNGSRYATPGLTAPGSPRILLAGSLAD